MLSGSITATPKLLLTLQAILSVAKSSQDFASKSL